MIKIVHWTYTWKLQDASRCLNYLHNIFVSENVRVSSPYPMVQNSKKLRNIFQKYGHFYFSGHLHTGYSLTPEMWLLSRSKGAEFELDAEDSSKTHVESSLQTGHTHHSYLEAELGDWKDYRVYRIIIVDNGIATFKDFTFESEQKFLKQSENNIFHVIPTFPKDFRQLIPDGKEPYFGDDFEEIRFFVFGAVGSGKIKEIYVQEQNTLNKSKFECNFVDENEPLVTCPIGDFVKSEKENIIKNINAKNHHNHQTQQTIIFKIYINGKYQNLGVSQNEHQDLKIRIFKKDTDIVIESTAIKFVKIILLSYAEIMMPLLFYGLLGFGFLVLFGPELIFEKINFTKVHVLFYHKLLNSPSKPTKFLKFFLKYWFFIAAFGPWHFVEVISGGNYGLVSPFGIFYLKIDDFTFHRVVDPAIFLDASRCVVGFLYPLIFILVFVLRLKYNSNEKDRIGPSSSKNNSKKLLTKTIITIYCCYFTFKSWQVFTKLCKYFTVLSVTLNMLVFPFHAAGLVVFPGLIYWVVSDGLRIEDKVCCD